MISPRWTYRLGVYFSFAQVFREGVRLLSGPEVVQELVLRDDMEVGGLEVPTSVSITSVDLLDPFIILLLSNGSLRLMAADDGEFCSPHSQFHSHTLYFPPLYWFHAMLVSFVFLEHSVPKNCGLGDRRGERGIVWLRTSDHISELASFAVLNGARIRAC